MNIDKHVQYTLEEKTPLKDIDSIVNNKQFGEDDLGQANVIISIKTGALVTYTITVITITLI